jgi:Zn-dependent metalloprotease
MNSTTARPLYWIILLVFAIGLLGAPAQAQTPGDDPGPGEPNPAFSDSVGPAAQLDPDWQIEYHAVTGKARFLSTRSGASILQPQALAADATAEDAARQFLSAYGELFGLKDAGESLRLIKSKTDEQEREFVRFQQVQGGIPILGGELIVELDAQKNVAAVIGEALPEAGVNLRPRVSAEAARTSALQAIAKQYELLIEELEADEPTLWIYDPALLDAASVSKAALVWRTEVRGKQRLDIRELTLVDAQIGALALHFNQVDAARYRIVYDNANDYTRGLPGTAVMRQEGGAATGILDVDNAYDYMGFTYDYYSSRYSRDGIDNKGMKMVATVRYCPNSTSCPYANAFWNSSQMVFGAGYASADDVMAHELTHGVTEHESGLFYYMQSGAINESFSDIWGELVDLAYTNGLDNDSSGVRWQMGEDIPGGAIRSMSNPPAFSDPDRMGSVYYYCGGGDNGGVHINSGVGNKAAFLLSDGGTFNGYTVSGIGLEKTGHIWYYAATNLLTSAADYKDLAVALSQSCQSQIGQYGIAEADCSALHEVIAAVEMTSQPACAAPHAPLCNSYGYASEFNGSVSSFTSVNGLWWADSNYLNTNGVASEWASVYRNYPIGDGEFTVSMKRQGCDGCANGIVLRGAPYPLGDEKIWNNGYFFAYTRNRAVEVFYQDGANWSWLQTWSNHEAVNGGDAWNTLRVVTQGGRIEFYINDKLIWAGADERFRVGNSGVLMYRSADSTGDLLQVDYARLNGGSPITLYKDTMENPANGSWFQGVISGGRGWYHPNSGNPFDFDASSASSGIYNLWGYDQPTVNDVYVSMAQSVNLPAGKTAYLHFNHTYSFEGTPSNAYDGGVLEYSTNGGSSWSDAGSLFDFNGYNATIRTGFSNPLGGRAGFGGASNGPISSRLNLGTLAGQSVRFRYRIGSDSSNDGYGWFVDDVHLYTCAQQSYEVHLPLAFKSGGGIGSFHSSFSGTSPGWTTQAGSWWSDPQQYITNGTPSQYSSSAFTLSDYANLAVEARFKRVGCTTCTNRILIRGTPTPFGSANIWNQYYAFAYSGDGYYSVWKRSGGTSTALQSWTASSAIKAGEAWNWLRVYANGTTLQFYINGTLVWSGTDSTLTNGKVGIEMYGGTGWDQFEADWVQVTSFGSSLMEDIFPTLPLPGDGSGLSPAIGGDEAHSP